MLLLPHQQMETQQQVVIHQLQHLIIFFINLIMESTFTATSTSELGSVSSETSVFMMSCVDFSPSVSVSLSNLFVWFLSNNYCCSRCK